MTGIVEHIVNYLKIKEIRAQEVDEEKCEEGRYWPRLLSFRPGPQSKAQPETQPPAQPPPQPCEDEDELQEIEITITTQESEEEGCDEDDKPRRPSAISRKLQCMYHSAKHGLKEGALSGIFFGGGWGIYKYLDAVYLNKGSKEGSEEGGADNSEDNGSTLNNNVIFVTAANGAIAMGVFCTFFCCTKAAIYC